MKHCLSRLVPSAHNTKEPINYMGTITGVIEHTRYRNAENGWTIALVQPPTGDRVTCVGTILTDSLLGLTFMFEGDWSVHPQYGRQFTFTAARPVRPTGIDGLRKYLAASINGLGEHTAEIGRASCRERV